MPDHLFEISRPLNKKKYKIVDDFLYLFNYTSKRSTCKAFCYIQ